MDPATFAPWSAARLCSLPVFVVTVSIHSFCLRMIDRRGLARSKNRFPSFGTPRSGAIQSSDPPTPSCLAMARQPSPWLLRAAIFVGSRILGGLPSCFPFARAFLRPARTRSAIKLRSNSATAPRIEQQSRSLLPCSSVAARPHKHPTERKTATA